MTLDWGLWKARARDGMARLGNAALIGAVGLLALFLAAQTSAARRERSAVRLESAALDRQIGRLRGSNQALRDEIRALESDPVYVESLLRRWKRIGDGERRVE